jgi:hypothetical protein
MMMPCMQHAIFAKFGGGKPFVIFKSKDILELETISNSGLQFLEMPCMQPLLQVL